MIFELWILLLSSLLGLVNLSAASFAFKAQVGNRYTVGARDEDLKPVGVAARLYRAQNNFLETLPIFVALLFLVYMTHASGDLSKWGSGLYFVGRAVYLPLYAYGVPWLRTFSWNLATLGLVLVGAAAFIKLI